MRHPSAETARQLLHIVSGLWALGLRWLGPLPLMALAGSALAFNVWLLPRLGGRRLWRPVELTQGSSAGMILYPLSVLILLTVYFRRPEVAAAGWGLLAFGDGAATLAGKLWGRRPLPWNRQKTVGGFVAYWLAGWIAVSGLVAWTVPGRYDTSFLVGVGGVVSLLGAFLESVPQRLDDNLTVPLLGSLILVCLLETHGYWLPLLQPFFFRRLWIGMFINLVMVIGARAVGTLDRGGAVAAWVLGTAVFAFLSWAGYAVLLTFFVLGNAATRAGQRATSGSWRGGQRGSRRAANALANGSVAAVCAILARTTPHEAIFQAAYLCGLAAAAADTVESEIGQVWGRTTVLITSWRRVEPGVDGGVSLAGTVAGAIASLITMGVGWLAGLSPQSWILPLSSLALVATLVESVLGATLERQALLDNEGVNFANTLLAAILGATAAGIMG